MRDGVLRRHDLDVLLWIAEQYAARYDQLERLLGGNASTWYAVLARLRAERLVTTRRLLLGERTWVTPTVTGLNACQAGFKAWRLHVSKVRHVAAVNDVRLHIEGQAPECEWLCERILRCEHERGTHLPDALVFVDSQRVAIEVELTRKDRKRAEAILDRHSANFDSVVYFCASRPHRLLTELHATGRWPALAVREMPTVYAT